MQVKHFDFWQNQQGINNIKPRHVGELWESFNIEAVVKNLVGSQAVVDVGCGVGRLAPAFTVEQYIGVDPNKLAINIAQQENPKYQFIHLQNYNKIPKQCVMLLISVALHIPDDEIQQVFQQAGQRIIIGETMMRRKTRKPSPGYAPHYTRTPADYKSLFSTTQWDEADTFELYDTNSNKLFTFVEFRRIAKWI